MAGLTPKQERFAQLYVELGTAAEAYRRAYESEGKPETCQREGHAMLNNPKVAARVGEIQERLAELAIWKRLDSLETLAAIARREKAQDKDKVAAVKAINSMHGWDKTTIDHMSSDGSMTPDRGRSLDDFYEATDVSTEPEP